MRVKIFEFWPILHTGHMANMELRVHFHMQMSYVMSLPVRISKAEVGQYGEFQFFEYFHLNYSVLLSDNKPNEMAIDKP